MQVGHIVINDNRGGVRYVTLTPAKTVYNKACRVQSLKSVSLVWKRQLIRHVV